MQSIVNEQIKKHNDDFDKNVNKIEKHVIHKRSRQVSDTQTGTTPPPPKKPQHSGSTLKDDDAVAGGDILKGVQTAGKAGKPVDSNDASASSKNISTTTTTAKPTLVPTTSTTPTTTIKTTTVLTTTLSPLIPCNASDSECVSQNSTDNVPSMKTKIYDATQKVYTTLQNLTKVQFAYLTIASLVFAVSIVFMCSCCCDMW